MRILKFEAEGVVDNALLVVPDAAHMDDGDRDMMRDLRNEIADVLGCDVDRLEETEVVRDLGPQHDLDTYRPYYG